MTNPQTTGQTLRYVAALSFVAGTAAQARTCPPRLPSITVAVDHLRGASLFFSHLFVLQSPPTTGSAHERAAEKASCLRRPSLVQSRASSDPEIL